MADGDGYQILTENLETFYNNILDETELLAKNSDRMSALMQLSFAAGEIGMASMLDPVANFFAVHETTRGDSLERANKATQGFNSYAMAAGTIHNNYGMAEAHGESMIRKLEKTAVDLLFAKQKGDGEAGAGVSDEDVQAARNDLLMSAKEYEEKYGTDETPTEKTEKVEAYEFHPLNGSLTITTPDGDMYFTGLEDELDPVVPENGVVTEQGQEPPRYYEDGNVVGNRDFKVPEIEFTVPFPPAR